MKKILLSTVLLLVSLLGFSQVPVMISISGPTAVCSAPTAAMNFTASATNAPTSYSWSVLPAAGVVIGNQGSAITSISFPFSNGVYTITANASNASGTSTPISYTVSVFETPSITFSGANFFCQGSSTNIQASATILAASPTIQYNWSPAGGLNTPVGPNVIAFPGITTQYTVTATKGICSNTAAITVSVLPVPSLTTNISNTIICPGTPITLLASGANTYTWTNGVTNGVSFTPASSTIYYVTGTNASGCTSTASVNVTVASLTVGSTAQNLCPGNSVTLTVSGGSGYQWNPGALSGANVVVNPNVTTIYTVTGTGGPACNLSKTISVNVLPGAVTGVTANSTLVCLGNSTTLTPMGAATLYSWMPVWTTSTGSLAVTPTANTIYTVTSNQGPCPGSQTVAITVTNMPLPSVSANSSTNTICSGSNVNLNANGAVSYTWFPGGMAGSSVVASPSVTTAYTVVGTGTNGFYGTSVVNVSVNPGPISVTGFTNVCVGGSLTLNASGATSYTWNPGNLNGSTVVVTPLANTVYTVSGSTAPCPGINSKTFTVVVNSGPNFSVSTNNSTLCAGASATLTFSGASNYSVNGASSPSETVVSPTVTTTYTVTGNNFSCNSTVLFTQFVDPCEGIAEYYKKENKLLVYPNPNNGTFIMVSGNSENFELLNDIGQVIIRIAADPGKEIKIENLPTGVYILRSSRTVTKLVVIK